MSMNVGSCGARASCLLVPNEILLLQRLHQTGLVLELAIYKDPVSPRRDGLGMNGVAFELLDSIFPFTVKESRLLEGLAVL